ARDGRRFPHARAVPGPTQTLLRARRARLDEARAPEVRLLALPGDRILDRRAEHVETGAAVTHFWSMYRHAPGPAAHQDYGDASLGVRVCVLAHPIGLGAGALKRVRVRIARPALPRAELQRHLCDAGNGLLERVRLA